MKAVVLAAGQGKRMQPLTNTRPKVMLPLANKPILEWNLIKAHEAGLDDFIFVVGYKSEMIRNYFNDGSDWGVHITYVNQGKPQGTGQAIGVVEPFIDDEFLVLSGDSFFSTKDIHTLNETNNSVGLITVENPEQYGIVETKNEAVIKIYEKMKKPFSNVINTGIYHFSEEIFSYIRKIKKSHRGEYELTDAINMYAKDTLIKAVMIDTFQDIGYPWDLLQANEEILTNMLREIHGTIDKFTSLEGIVIIGENTHVMQGSYIQGPVIIGKDCTIGPNCYIRPYTAIGDGCHIGAAVELKNSVVMDHTNIPHHNYVGDSVIGSGCNLGSGTKVANLRLDKKEIIVEHYGKKIPTKRKKLGVIMGDNVQTGINAVINVGSIIGDHVMIGPGTNVHGLVDKNAKIL